MGADRDKLLLPLGGSPVVAWSLRALEQSGVVDSVTVTVSESNRETIARAVEATASSLPVTLVVGGPRRQDSVHLAVELLAERAPSMVLVHDGARPLVRPELVAAVLDAAAEHGAAIPGLPLKDACKAVDDRGFVARSLDRSSLVAVQTPQAFRFDILLRAHREGLTAGLSVDDDAELVERLGCPVKVLRGDARNLKITTPDDLAVAEGYVGSR